MTTDLMPRPADSQKKVKGKKSTRRSRSRSVRPIWMEKPGPVLQVLKGLVIAFICVIMLYPLIYVIAMSFGTAESIQSGQLFPTEFSLDAYESVLAGGVVTRALLSSALITLVGTTLSVLMTAMLAYGLTRVREVPGAKFVLVLVLLTMLFGAGMIPMYLLVKGLGLLNSIWAIVLPGMIGAFNMIVMRNFFMNLPNELFEAARVDGAGHFRIFFQIVLPLSKAVIAVIALFYAVGYWNVFFNAMIYLNDTEKWPIQVVLNQFVVQNSDLNVLQNPDRPPPPAQAVQMAVIVLATLPILIIYPFLQRYFTKGVLTGAIKT
ncbi:carbohydrate ABC transporter permease [Devriesea agamarum]|uniref:carbohydrate ABC transporter permease n=1 Tax=Devriesea agamarum TaxID=472569 RepID=UPI000ACCF1E9|nr:carbohydrate ABC transporter permease [Devriesea agamarum]